jgi:hypothetical protein
MSIATQGWKSSNPAGIIAHFAGKVMDLPQSLIFDLGWVFFAAWTMVLAALSAVAFGRDLFPFGAHNTRQTKHH